MKRTITIILSLGAFFGLYAQDARQRTVETVVADVLAAMPARNSADLDTQIADLAAAAPASVVELARLMKPASEGVRNNLFEYALSGLVSHAAAHPAVLEKVSLGFVQAIDQAADTEVKAFLMSQFRSIADGKYVDIFIKNMTGDVLSPIAMGALVDIPGTEDLLLGLVKAGRQDKSLLAAAAAGKGLRAAEPYLQQWASASTGAELGAICSALASVGSASSLDLLAGNSWTDYAALATRLAKAGDRSKAVAKAARSLMKSDVPAFRSAGAEALMNCNPAKAPKVVSDALKSSDGAYRAEVLQDATALLGAGNLVPLLTKSYSKASEGAKLDILDWLGDNKVKSATDLVLGAFQEGGEISRTAISAAGKIGGDRVAKALVGQLAGDNSAAALTALESFRGDIQDDVVAALAVSPGQHLGPLVSLASRRRMTKAAPLLFKLAGENPGLASALSGVVGPEDVNTIADLIDRSTADGRIDLNDLTNALNAAVHTLPPDQQYKTISRLIAKSPDKEYYYASLAKTGTDQAVEDLAEAYEAGNKANAALGGLMSIDNYKAAPVLLDIARKTSDKDGVLSRYAELVHKYETDPGKARYDFARALELAGSKDVKNRILGFVGGVPTMKAFLLAGRYLDDSGTAYAAANAVKNIASKCREEINYADFKTNLEKARKIFKARGGADDGYAADEIDKMLLEAEPSPVSELTAEEKGQGFEMLFDGTDLDKWQGDKEGYTPVNGTIYVSAGYGAGGNLYTIKEYRNFVYRFEFCFLREGVNNGVGVRTPMGVDAAYDGMCEVQILDHDAPMYANLHDYQVHGSVYGVIPAKRIKHKPLGEWETEEIRVEGDRIKVTVNGEVIVDGNIRKACKGHNVAPDGTKVNPYTVDHRNHPGMFNKQGFISFCGHGEGLKIRNVRILDLGGNK